MRERKGSILKVLRQDFRSSDSREDKGQERKRVLLDIEEAHTCEVLGEGR